MTARLLVVKTVNVPRVQTLSLTKTLIAMLDREISDFKREPHIAKLVELYKRFRRYYYLVSMFF